jgi:hypothetical protein
MAAKPRAPRRPKVQVRCENPACGQYVLKHACEVARHDRFFCNRECLHTGRRGGLVSFVCARPGCGQQVTRPRSQVRAGYCSPDCQRADRKAQGNVTQVCTLCARPFNVRKYQQSRVTTCRQPDCASYRRLKAHLRDPELFAAAPPLPAVLPEKRARRRKGTAACETRNCSLPACSQPITRPDYLFQGRHEQFCNRACQAAFQLGRPKRKKPHA